MARAFNDDEKEEIRQSLITEFTKLLEHHSIQKISIDDLIDRAGISKGSFYLFYESKEWLFVDVVNSVQMKIVESVLDLAKEDLPATDKLKNILRELINQFSLYPWLQKLTSIEYEKNIRRLPTEVREELLSSDVSDLTRIFDLMEFKPKVDLNVIAGAVQIILCSMINKEHFGEYYQSSLDLLIDSLVKEIA